MKTKKVYIRLIVSYLVVFMIPLVLNVFQLNSISRTTEENVCEGFLTSMNHTKDVVDGYFQEIDMIVQKLSSNSTVRYVATQMDERDKYVEISKILSTQEYMKSTQLLTFVEEYYLYFKESGMVVSPSHIFLDQEAMSYFFQYDDMEQEKWKDLLEETYAKAFFPETYTRQNSSRENMILYVQSLVTDSGAKGTFVFPIKSDSVIEMVKDTCVSPDGWFYICDKEGNLLLKLSSDKEEFELLPEEYMENSSSLQDGVVGGNKVKIIKTKSSETGLTYVTVLPRKYITEQIGQARNLILTFMVIVLALGGIAILALSWRRGRKIAGMLKMILQIGDEGGNGTKYEEVKGDEIGYISDSLKKLINKNADYKETIRKQEPLTKALLLEQLLRGGVLGNTIDSLREMGIHLEGHRLVLLAYQMEEQLSLDDASAGDTAVYKQLLYDGVQRILAGEKYTCDMDVDSGTIICLLDEDVKNDKEVMIHGLEEICEKFLEEFGIEVHIAVSTVCESVEHINKAYDQVYEMLQYGTSSEKKVLLYEDSLAANEYYYFPVPLEDRLVNAVRSGDTKKMHDQMREIYQVNVMEKNISPSMMHFLVNDLQCTVFKTLHNLDSHVNIEEEEIYGQLEQLNRENDILLRFNRINHIFLYICEKIKEGDNENDSRQKQQIEDYIAGNYMDNEMGLTKIAGDFGYASTYFSKLFKELFHENFATYLERVRIEKVCELLNSGEKLENIAAKTGYNSVYVLRTAFKRIKGMTPNDYRKMNH